MNTNVLVPVLLLLVAGAGAAEDDSIFFRSTLPPAEKSYKILFLTPTKLKSHMLAQHPLMIALANRGHKVVLLSEASWTDRHPNVTYLDHTAQVPGPGDRATFSTINNLAQMFRILSEGLEQYAKVLYDDPVVQSLYKIRKEFDMIVIDDMSFKVLYPFVHGTTFAKFTGSVLEQHNSALFGNPLNPAFVSSGSEEFPQPYSTWHRFKNFFHMFVQYTCYRYFVHRLATAEVASRFPSLPEPHVVEKNASLSLVTADFTLDGVFPTVPLLVPVAGFILRPTQPLPKNISEFLSGDTPAILVSMGFTFGSSSQIPQVYRDIFYSVFSQLPYKILLKFDEPQNPKYPNIFFQNWFPQQDVLAHPNVRAFISHGGVQTVHEAVYHGVPILGMPYTPPIRRMIQGLVLGGQGLMLEWSDLSVQTLNDSIMEIMQNPSYALKMAEKSRIFRDQRESPMDRAVYWIEYVTKYQGAPHLQSPAKHLTWIEIFNLDIIALCFFILYVLFKLLMWCIRKLIRWMLTERRERRNKRKVH